MRLCPKCGNFYADDANFCPMDATRLPPPSAAQPATPAIAATPATAATAPSQPATAPSQPNQTLREPPLVAGRYKISGPLTASPTGESMPAVDTQSGKEVTLKLASAAALPTTALADRALREWKQLSRVTSTRVATVLDQGRAEDGRVFVVTQPSSGITLEELVAKSGPLSVARAAAIVLQVGEALTEAQKVGVIHRDVAPRNIIVGDGDQAQLIDFGLAEPTSDKVFGSPGFVSPEQVEGRPVDQRSNIYSLGAVVYFAVAGQAPFVGESAQVLSQHLQAPPPPLTSLVHGTPDAAAIAGLDRVVQKALEKSGGRRHLTLRQFLTEIEAVSGAKAAAAPTAAVAPKTEPDLKPAGAQVARNPQERPLAATVMGISSPLASKKSAPEARTRMAEAPVLPATAQMATAAPVESAPVAPIAAAPAPAPAPVAAPVAAAPQPVAAPVAPAAPANVNRPTTQAKPTGRAKGGFRETAWFKQGEIQEELAKIEAEASPDPLAPTGITGKHATVDPAELTTQDQKRLSLRTGGTGMMAAIDPKAKGKASELGERMDESEMLAELDNSKKTKLIALVVVGVLALVAVLYFAVFRKATAQVVPPDKPAAVAIAPPGAATTPAAANPSAAPAVAHPPPAPPVTPPVAAPAAPAVAPTMDASRAAFKAGDLDGAVTALKGAEAAGAKGKAVKKYELVVRRAIAQKALVAKKHHDKDGEAQARALAAKMK